MSTLVTTASARAVSGAPTERVDVPKFGGIAAIAAAVVVISPVIVFAVVMPALGLKTREDYATYAVVQDKWPLMMIQPLIELLLGFLSLLVGLALYERLARVDRNMMRLSLGLAFMACMSFTIEGVRSIIAYFPASKLTDTPGTEQYEPVLRLMLGALEPIFLFTGVVVLAISTAVWGLVALKGSALPKALSAYALGAGILGALVSPIFNLLFVVLYLWLGVSWLRSARAANSQATQ
jgi:hypothetical protein